VQTASRAPDAILVEGPWMECNRLMERALLSRLQSIRHSIDVALKMHFGAYG